MSLTHFTYYPVWPFWSSLLMLSNNSNVCPIIFNYFSCCSHNIFRLLAAISRATSVVCLWQGLQCFPGSQRVAVFHNGLYLLYFLVSLRIYLFDRENINYLFVQLQHSESNFVQCHVAQISSGIQGHSVWPQKKCVL